jgi:hypothetical protein
MNFFRWDTCRLERTEVGEKRCVGCGLGMWKRRGGSSDNMAPWERRRGTRNVTAPCREGREQREQAHGGRVINFSRWRHGPWSMVSFSRGWETKDQPLRRLNREAPWLTGSMAHAAVRPYWADRVYVHVKYCCTIEYTFYIGEFRIELHWNVIARLLETV